MDESEKRRERLKTMRIEAAGAVDDSSGSASSAGLSNPLVERQDCSSASTQYFSSRFDYYTDPMAAFSGARKDDITRPPRPNMTPQPAYQAPALNAPNQNTSQVPGAHYNQRPIWRPMEMATPSNIPPQGNPPNTWGPPGVPVRPFNYNYPPGRPEGFPPNDRFGPAPAFNNYATPRSMPRGASFSNPSFRHGGPPNYGRGIDQRYNSRPHYDSGRGGRRYPDSNRGRDRSPGARTGGWRGGGSHGSVSAETRPDLYYKKEMVEDPWAGLTPVIWKGKDSLTGDGDDKSWLPKSITKKAKVCNESPQAPISQQSLAEYLASSFGDSADELVHKEPST